MTRSKNRTHCKHSCHICDPGKYEPGVPKASDRRRMQDEGGEEDAELRHLERELSALPEFCTDPKCCPEAIERRT